MMESWYMLFSASFLPAVVFLKHKVPKSLRYLIIIFERINVSLCFFSLGFLVCYIVLKGRVYFFIVLQRT